MLAKQCMDERFALYIEINVTITHGSSGDACGLTPVPLVRNEKQLNMVVLFLYYFILLMADFRLYFPVDICVTLAL
jgi:hypothetical protein